MHILANTRLFPLSKMTINFYDFQAKIMLLVGGMLGLYLLRLSYFIVDNRVEEICVLITN